MTQVTSASDIWSVGCLILELLTGYPPYYDLQPMSALFRIVQVRVQRAACSGLTQGSNMLWTAADFGQSWKQRLTSPLARPQAGAKVPVALTVVAGC